MLKNSLSYLPEIKQNEILQLVEIIKSVANPEKIILFGSYATNKYVEDTYLEDGVRFKYISDYDFLIVSSKEEEKEFIKKSRIIDKARVLFKTPVNPLIHSIDYINEGLEIGQYFFTDIIKEGVLLYDTGENQFSAARVLSKEEKIAFATRHFEQWYASGRALLKSSNFNFNEAEYKLAIFELHQACECFYNAVLLVFTGYKPKTHNLDILRQFAKPLSKELFALFPFPNENEFENHLFDLLKRSYIEARYKNDYSVDKDELTILMDKISKMKTEVEKICNQHVNEIQ